MSEPSKTAINGPLPSALPPKDVHPEMTIAAPRPQLIRIDSRSSLPPRPQYPPVRAPIRPFIQRPPGPQFRPNPNFRPSSPFPRPLQVRPPGIVPQRSLQDQPYRVLPENLIRSQTLDPALDNGQQPQPHVEGVRPTMKNRSFSLISGNEEHNLEDRRRSVQDVLGSLEEKDIETEKKTVEMKQPDSRPQSRIEKIPEDSLDKSLVNVQNGTKSNIPTPIIQKIAEPDNKNGAIILNGKDKDELNKLDSDNTKIQEKQSDDSKSKDIKIDIPDKHEIKTEKIDPKPEIKAEIPNKPETKTETHSESIKNTVDIKKQDPSIETNNMKIDNKPPIPEPKTVDPKIEIPTENHNQNKKQNSDLTPTKSIISTAKQPKIRIQDNKSPEIETIKNGTKKTDTKNNRNLDLNVKLRLKKEGDNDSGVDESTQGNDQSSNGDHSSPRKSSGKATTRTSSTTPTKNRSLSRGSNPSLKSPDSNASTPGATEKKKVPMNKVQVGSAPSPNLKVVRSKIGSLDNASYKPGGGHVKIENKKIDFKNAAPRIEAKNDKYTPKGGDKKIQQQKLQWNAKSKIGSLENASHKPKGGDKKIESVKLDFKEKAKSKVGSKDNIKHVPGGGDIKIETKKLDLKVQSKIGSFENVKHKPGGGEKKIFDDKDYLKQMSSTTSENHSLSGSQHSLPSQPELAAAPLADENLNEER